jgi:hypothetical protein
VNRKLGAQAIECDERLTQAFTLLGKRWSGVILGLLLQGPARFAVLARTIPGISERMLSDRLNELARASLDAIGHRASAPRSGRAKPRHLAGWGSAAAPSWRPVCETGPHGG